MKVQVQYIWSIQEVEEDYNEYSTRFIGPTLALADTEDLADMKVRELKEENYGHKYRATRHEVICE